MAYAKFTLTKIHCIETEDNVGDDEFYVVGMFAVHEKGSNTPKEIGTPKISGVWDINNGESEEPAHVIYDAVFFNPEDHVLKFELKCLDKDIASDLEGIPDNILKRASDAAARASEEVEAAKAKLKEEAKDSGAFELVEEIAGAINPIKDAIDAADFALDTLWDIIYGGLSLDKDDLLGEGRFTYIPGGPVAVPVTDHPVDFECRWDGCFYKVQFTVTLMA